MRETSYTPSASCRPWSTSPSVSSRARASAAMDVIAVPNGCPANIVPTAVPMEDLSTGSASGASQTDHWEGVATNPWSSSWTRRTILRRILRRVHIVTRHYVAFAMVVQGIVSVLEGATKNNSVTVLQVL